MLVRKAKATTITSSVVIRPLSGKKKEKNMNEQKRGLEQKNEEREKKYTGHPIRSTRLTSRSSLLVDLQLVIRVN